MNFSFIHIADIHLGRPFSDLSKYSYDQNINLIYKTAVEKSFKNIIDYALLKNVDFVFIAGDTFDSLEQDFSSKLILKENLKRLSHADIKTFLICGNHDCLNSYNKNTFNYDENSNIKIVGLNTSRYADIELYNKNDEKVGILHALSFVEEKMNENPLQYFTREKNEKLFNIGLLHCDLNADEKSPYAPCSLSELQSFGYDYWALGHIHIPTGDEGNIQYAGTIQGRNTKETSKHGFRYVKVENNNIVKNSFVAMDVVRFEDINADITEARDLTDVSALIKEEINKIVNTEQNLCDLFLVRLNLLGCIKFYSELSDENLEIISEKIKSDFNNKVYISQITNTTVPFVEEALLKDDEGIAGEIYKVIKSEKLTEKLFNETNAKLKNVIIQCNFTDDDYFQIIEEAKEECLNLCNFLYETESGDS